MLLKSYIGLPSLHLQYMGGDYLAKNYLFYALLLLAITFSDLVYVLRKNLSPHKCGFIGFSFGVLTVVVLLVISVVLLNMF